MDRRKGSGTFVKKSKVVHESTAFITGYRAESRKHNRVLRTKVLELVKEPAPEHVASALELKPGEYVTRLTRLRHLEHYNNNAPVVYTTLYVPLKLFPDMERVDFTDVSFYDVLTARGLEVRHASRRLEVVPPAAEVALGLEISPFEPVIFISSKGYTGGMIPIEYTESYYPSGTSSFMIEVNR